MAHQVCEHCYKTLAGGGWKQLPEDFVPAWVCCVCGKHRHGPELEAPYHPKRKPKVEDENVQDP